MEGQRAYHGDLDKAMRAYIQQHQSEFMPEGVDLVEIAVPEPIATTSGTTPGADDTPAERERERNQRGLQWAWDTFDGAYQVAKRSTKGALELIGDAWESSSSTTILYFLIVGLVLSNLWTYMRMGSPKREQKLTKADDPEQWVAGVVTTLWDELAARNQAPPAIVDPPAKPIVPPPAPAGPPSAESLKQDISALQGTLDAVEERVKSIRENLAAIQGLNSLD
jgi:hypothetical protein